MWPGSVSSLIATGRCINVQSMDSLLTIIPVTAAAYLATNLDNFTLLVSLLARYRGRTVFVSLGYLSSMMVLGFVAFWIGEAADQAPVEYLGLLGLVPISVGIAGLVRLYRNETVDAGNTVKAVASGQAVFLATFFTQLGNGADTIVTFGVLFADSKAAADPLIISTMALMAASFVLAGVYGVRHRLVSDWVGRYAHRVTPFILIFVGAYVIVNTATDIMPD